MMMQLMPHLLATCSAVFFFAALLVPDWSNGTVSIKETGSNAFGEIYIGLWKACAEITTGNALNPTVFSAMGDCRMGHCTLSETLTGKDTSWNAENLCDKSSVTQAFLIIALLVTLGELYSTSYPAATDKDISWGRGFVLSIISTLCSLIAWATWVNWNNTMNGNRPSVDSSDKQVFSELDLGPGCTLAIFGWLFAAIRVLFLKSRYDMQVEFESKKDQRLSQNFEPNEAGGDEPYLEVGTNDESAGKITPNLVQRPAPAPRVMGNPQYGGNRELTA